MVPPVLGETDSSAPALTLQQAIDLALQHDKGLKKAELEVERTEKLREAAAEKINFTPIMGSTYDATTQVNWNNLLSADLTWRMSKKSLEAERDSLVLKTCKSYWDVQTALEKVALQEKLEQQALLNLQIARAGLQAGTAASYQVVEAEGRWQQAKNNLEAARQALEDAYNTFNQLVGLDTKARPVLTDNP
ncbi:MAG: TolC family protein, partial [Moorella sp. (in: Bacteria)]|nr:TolC family protein [Moorella sp. (in: firmicutes)]